MEKTVNVTQEFRKIFSGEQKMSEEEQDALLDALLFMRDDVELGLGQDVIQTWMMKIAGVIEFLVACGKITAGEGDDPQGEQEEQLYMLLKKIEDGKGL